jgi:AraC-like DNA-binding protein
VWEWVTAPVHPRLRPWVRRITGYREDAGGPLERIELPGPRATLILSFGDRIEVGGQGRTFTSFASGLHDRPVPTAHGGRLAGIQVDLTPFGAYALYGLPLRELANTAVDLADLPGGGRLPERLAETAGWPARFALLEGELAARLEAGPAPSPEVAHAWARLETGGGRTPVAALVGETGWSHRHLVARFHEQVGLAPKAVARLFRFERALALLDCGPLAEVAAAAGFFDQGHMNREFRRLAGATPVQLRAVRFVQDGEAGAA